MKIDDSGRITDFAEKPKDKEVIEEFRLTRKAKKRLGIDNPDMNFLASMGNYVFFWDRLKQLLNLPGMDFGKDIIPGIKENNGSLYAYVFKGYWRDVGKVQDYFECNMEFTDSRPPIAFPERRIRARESCMSLCQIANGVYIRDVALSPDNVVRAGSSVRNCVFGSQITVEERCKLDHCILIGNDRNGHHGNSFVRGHATSIGKGSRLSYVILDRNVWIGENVDVGPHNGTPERRSEILQSIGLKPYRELDDGMVEGDFYIEPDTGILIIGRQNADLQKPILPDGTKC